MGWHILLRYFFNHTSHGQNSGSLKFLSHTCAHTHRYTRIHTRKHTRTNTWTNLQEYTVGWLAVWWRKSSLFVRVHGHTYAHTHKHTHTHTHTQTHTHTKNTQETRNWFVFSPHTYRRCAVRRLVVWWRNPPLCVRARIARKSVSVTCMCVECQYVWHSKEIVKFGLW